MPRELAIAWRHGGAAQGYHSLVLPRFFVPGAGGAIDGAIDLPRDEAHHASRVMRLSAGDEVAVFDGAGHEWRARIESAERDRVRVRLLDPVMPVPEPRTSIVLLHAALKGDHMDAVVRDATMMGASEIRPTVTAHTVARASGASAQKLRDRWARVAVASAKQCRSARVPDIFLPVVLSEALRSIGAAQPGELRAALAEPAANVPTRVPAAISSAAPARAIIAVGPEGGWSQDELGELRAAGFEAVTLGAFTLRADAAALVAISAFRAVWGE